MKLSLDQIRFDFQPSENLTEETVADYLSRIQAGETLEPVRVRFDGESYFLEDGFHRVEAMRRAGIATIDAEVLPGTLDEMEARFQEYLKELKASLRKG